MTGQEGQFDVVELVSVRIFSGFFLPIEEVVSVNCSVVILLNVKVDHMCEMLVISTQVGRQLELKLRLRCCRPP